MAEPKLVPLNQWICDTCNKKINTPDEGWVEWVSFGGEIPPQEFYIVHNDQFCYRHSRRRGRKDMHLEYFLGPDGLMKLMSLYDPGAHNYSSNLEIVLPKDMLEWNEIVRRLQIPYYEEARHLWRIVQSEGEFDGVNEYLPYTQEFMKRLIEDYGDCIADYG